MMELVRMYNCNVVSQSESILYNNSASLNICLPGYYKCIYEQFYVLNVFFRYYLSMLHKLIYVFSSFNVKYFIFLFGYTNNLLYYFIGK